MSGKVIDVEFRKNAATIEFVSKLRKIQQQDIAAFHSVQALEIALCAYQRQFGDEKTIEYLEGAAEQIRIDRNGA